MKVFVLSRTEANGRRILHEAFSTYEKAEAARQQLLKMYNAPSSLCIDTEIDEFEVQ